MNAIGKQLREAQLAALQNQIMPHYLVNTLDAFRMKLIMDGQNEIAELLRCFQSSLCTYGFEPGETVALEQEFAFLEDYLTVQKFRFLGKLTWSVSLQPQTCSLRIPRFLLQPLVENAVQHGLSPEQENPYLEIVSYLEEDMLCLSVSDNGKGCVATSRSGGIGLANINKRLQLLYGDNCAVELEALGGGGTRGIIRLPGKGGGLI